MRADRLLALMLLLQARGRVTARELAARLEVSERTIYRDISALGMAGVPVYAERGPGGGCSLIEGYRTTLNGLTETEARTLFMAGGPGVLRDLGLGHVLEDALLKLLAALPSTARRDAERARQRLHVDPGGWSHADEALPHLRTLQDTLWLDRRLRLRHRGADGEASERVVDPLGLVAKAGIWYLVTHTERGMRVFRVSRVADAEVLEEPCARPADFDLATYWAAWSAEFQAGFRQYRARVRVAPELMPTVLQMHSRDAERIAESASAPDGDGWVAVTLGFDSLEAARAQLLGFGTEAEALEPAELRASVAARAAEVAAYYAERAGN